MRHVAWIASSMLLITGCGSEGGPENGQSGTPANVTAPTPDFDEGYLRGQLGGVSVDGEATSVDVYTDCYDEGEGCQSSYTSATVTRQHADGSWGMTIIEIYDEGFRDLDEPPAGTAVYVIGCSGPAPAEADWDVGSEDVTVDEQPDPEDPNSTILTIQAEFPDADEFGENGQGDWWGEGGGSVTTMLRLTR